MRNLTDAICMPGIQGKKSESAQCNVIRTVTVRVTYTAVYEFMSPGTTL